MKNSSAIVDWMRGTGLRPYLERLDEGQQSSFLAHFEEAAKREFPPRADGRVLFPFPRLFVIAER